MARYVFEAYTRVVWATTVAVPASPTVAEIGAGVELSFFIAKDGLKPALTQNMVDNATIAETFDSQLVGSYSADFELTMFRDSVSADDDAWTACIYGTNGFLIIRYGIAVATAFAAAQRIQVWPAQMHQPVVNDSAANEQVRFTEKFAITSAPFLNATISSS